MKIKIKIKIYHIILFIIFCILVYYDYLWYLTLDITKVRINPDIKEISELKASRWCILHFLILCIILAAIMNSKIGCLIYNRIKYMLNYTIIKK